MGHSVSENSMYLLDNQIYNFLFGTRAAASFHLIKSHISEGIKVIAHWKVNEVRC